jgi:AhpD family alkylhydroperoxidase
VSRIPSKPINRYPFWLRFFFWNQKRKYGQPLEPAKLWARIPRIFLGVAALFTALDRRSSPINPVLRALITVRVSQINWCAFCVDINSSLVLKRGGNEEKINAVENFREHDCFSEAEKIALDYAETMTITGRTYSDELFARLHKHYTEDEIVELTGLIAFQNLSSKFNSALDVQPQGFCKIPPASHPPVNQPPQT